ncbi:hypothetical protein [uncultured Paraglaciecola sp.]|uniref:hypothetical protein n=1 Tax=uncultured Paraglaciecola sp. TaxID=1765024 RepID=UPI00260EAE01|nr:hypothetical protein [uncultured Paraglaciecola sp.]
MANPIMKALRGDQESLPDLVLPMYVPPRYGKTEMICHAIAWCYAHNPRANNIYASYKKMLAAEKTENVRKIMQSRTFQILFDARISKSSSAKDNFSTVQGGRTIAVGADGSGLGSGAGTTDKEPYGGGIFMDDMMKAQDGHSLAMITSVRKLYSQTLVNRRNDPKTTPIIHISQRISELDLGGQLSEGYNNSPLDNYQESWVSNAVIIPGLDSANNALWPEKHSKEYLLDLKKNDPFTFWSQIQQRPVSDSNRIFNTDAIVFFKEEPKIIATFVVADTAETADRVNDASVFSMFGVYETIFMGKKTGHIGLHWISCHQTRKEPEELVEEFEYFYGSCLRHKVIPDRVFIEKKSTGSMLLSFFKKRQGLIAVDIERNAGSGSKTNRFKMAAPFMAKGFVSMNEDCRHRDMCMHHLKQITLGGSQKHDDIADTLADGIRLGLEEKVIYNISNSSKYDSIADEIARENQSRRA